MRVLLVLVLYCVVLPLWAQTSTQTIKGTVTDAQTGSSLPGATILLLNSEPLKGTTSDGEGTFRLTAVPLGRQTLKVTYLGYGEQTVPNVLVTAGKEVVLDIRLQEQVITGQEVTIKARRDPDGLNNEFGTLSARTFNIENTRRFAGSRNDPSRMAANFAGVVGNNDSRNDIVIRGNSPTGLLWRLEGVDIPNPSHFGALGATGGPVSMLNNNLLAQSDFFTGAFPAMYGNALGGAFDLQLRTGNRDKREYTGQIGFNGFEAGLEGPFVKGKKGTYLVHYRYSVLSVVHKLGLSTGTGSNVPNYQDLSFKVDLPTRRTGSRWTLFGVGGTSHIAFKGELKDTANFYNDPYNNLYNKARMGVAGASYTHYFNEKTYLKTTLAATSSQFGVQIDSLNDARQAIPSYRDASSQGRLTLTSQFTRKLSARHLFSAGVFAHQLFYGLTDSVYVYNEGFRTLRDERGSTQLAQAYAQWQYKPSNRLTLNSGLHGTYFLLNTTYAIEPRLAARYELPARQVVSVGASLNSQLQPIQLYFYKTQVAPGRYVQTNRSLDLTRSAQGVAGYERSFGHNIRLKAEAYYQYLYHVPVEQRLSSLSILNYGATFAAPNVDSLVNTGKGKNYGLELTLERSFDRGYYFLTTLSLYESRYRGSDQVWRQTAYNGRYIANALVGKEWKLGDTRSLSLDTRMTRAGGRPYTPFDLSRSVAEGKPIYDDTRAFESRFKDYLRVDLKITFRHNGRHLTQEWFVDLQNLTNARNVFNHSFDSRSGQVRTQYQMGFFPNFNYRIEF
ncbi:TonB-dependent receptor [Telluribacter sp. SYSU D00476]|uniref:TonB-dependent receptor n=1 Tax=Telluribacter sp. SYSU D00476 TaxID=2811430 RepID=UPI001FF3DBDD|nr:TonB-dependent receptor [Telluribacter sp. SYSU D00476]